MFRMTKALPRGLPWLLPLLFMLGCGAKPVDHIPPRQDYTQVAAQLEQLIRAEMRDKDLPALSIALVDDQETVWAQGFGFADPDKKIPATASTVYRVGSVSKLFTDIGIMREVERGRLVLEAPITDYLPDFQPRNPFGKAITLRQLMSHRSGLVREPRVGNYFDPTSPSLQQTVQSLDGTTLVFAPESRIKYSNAAIAVAGYVLEHLHQQPFASYLKSAVLVPLGMQNSSFEPEPAIIARLAKAFMWSYDGRHFAAPTFQLGIMPAASLYAPVTDLTKFISALWSDNNPVLRTETLRQMWTPQFSQPGQTESRLAGIGFAPPGLHGPDRPGRVGYGGVVYGFATALDALPDDKLGVVVTTSLDGANAVVERIATFALTSMLAVKSGQSLPPLDLSAPVDSARAVALAGRYTNTDARLDLIERNGKLWLDNGTYRVWLKSRGDTLIVDDRLAYGQNLLPAAEGLRVGEKVCRRTEVAKPAPAPDRWQGLIGEYGWDHDVLFIYERDGQLYTLSEWFFSYPLREIDRDTFAFPDDGRYAGEKLFFVRDRDGKATEVKAANVVRKRRAVGTAAGETFRIQPRKPVEALRTMALAASPPQERGDFFQPDLVELASLDSTIRYDIRYASTNNFMSSVFYSQARAFLQRPAAAALVHAHHALQKLGYGLLIHDAYRPWYVTKMFWEATPPESRIFVADPSQGSRHNRGAAVDLTLYDLSTGKPVEMVGGYDEFSERSYPDYIGGTSRQRWHRELLRQAMEAQGFRVYEFEWWHFDFRDWRKYPIQNRTFEEILVGK